MVAIANTIEVTPDEEQFSLDPNLAVTQGTTTLKQKDKFVGEPTETLSLDPAIGVTEEVTRSSKSLAQFVKNTALNFPGSAWQLAKDYAQPFLHPIETYEGIKTIVQGYKELIAYDKFVAENPDSPKPLITDNMRMAQAVNEYFAGRYGDWTGMDADSWETRGQKVLRTIEEDPAGFLADIATVPTLAGTGINLTGRATSLMGKIAGPGVAQAGQAITKTGQAITKAGDVIDPITGSAKFLVNAYGNTAVPLLSGSRDTFSAAKKAYDISKNGDYNTVKELWKSMWDKISWDDIVGDFNKKVTDYKNTVSKEYGKWKTRIQGEKPRVPFESIEKITKLLDELESQLYDTKTITTETQTGYDRINNKKIMTKATTTEKVPNINANKIDLDQFDAMKEIFQNYKNTPINELTADNILSLKQKLGKLRFEGAVGPFDQYFKDFNKILEDDLSKVDPLTSDVMKDYNKMSDDLVELGKTIGESKRPQQQATKISQLIKNTPRGEIGLKNIEDILKDIDSITVPQITGQTLSKGINPFGGAIALGAGAPATFGVGGIPLLSVLSDPTMGALTVTGGLLASSPTALGITGSLLGLGDRFGVNLNNVTRGGRLGRPLQQTTDAPFPVDMESMDWRIDPETYNLGL